MFTIEKTIYKYMKDCSFLKLDIAILIKKWDNNKEDMEDLSVEHIFDMEFQLIM